LVRFRLILFFPALIALFFSGAARGQTPQNISIVQGNGQLICDGCALSNFGFFDSLVVRVTDGNGNPVPGAAVTWTVTSGSGSIPSSTTTGANTTISAGLCTAIGQSCNAYLPGQSAITVGTLIRSAVVATIANGNFVTFYLTQSPTPQANSTGIEYAIANLTGDSIQPGTTISGISGTQYGVPFKLYVQSYFGTPLPNVSLRPFPVGDNPAGGPSISCATGMGADPGSVLSDANGFATCFPVFGSVPGGPVPFRILLGGVSILQNPNDNVGHVGVPVGYRDFGPFNIVVTAATPGGVQLVSGNNPNLNRGQSATLVAKVVDTSGNALGGQSVTWTVSPSGYATINPATTTSDSTGQVSTVVTLSAIALGTVQVKATTANGLSATFSITVNSQVTGLTYVSGNNQSTPAGTAFANPLVVQVSTSSGVLAGNAVQFAITGGAGTLTPANGIVTTDANGRSQVRVTAGSVPGNIAVVATVAGFSQTFSLTVIPPGPSISGNSFLNGAGFFPSSGNNQTALSPCGIGTLVSGGTLSGFPATPNMFAAPMQQPTNVTIVFSGGPTGVATPAVPILSVTGSAGSQQVYTFQVPCELIPFSYNVTVTVNGGSATVPFVPVRPAAPGIFEIPMSDGIRRAVLVRPDGSFVSLQNPARRGENIRLYITGGGPTQPAVATGALPTPGVDVLPVDPNQIVIGVDSSGVVIVNSRLAPDLLGVWEITFTVPANARTANDVVLSVGVTSEGNPVQFSQGSRIPIQ
jgi:uncharacterized protein (TIGR03437 family)